VLQFEDAMDHLALGALHHPLARADVHQRPQLLLADLGAAILPLPAPPGGGVRGGDRRGMWGGGGPAWDSHVTGRFTQPMNRSGCSTASVIGSTSPKRLSGKTTTPMDHGRPTGPGTPP